MFEPPAYEVDAGFFSWGGSGDCCGESPQCGSRYEALGGVAFVHGSFVRSELVRESVQILRFGCLTDATRASSSVLGHNAFDNRREDIKSSDPPPQLHLIPNELGGWVDNRNSFCFPG